MEGLNVKNRARVASTDVNLLDTAPEMTVIDNGANTATSKTATSNYSMFSMFGSNTHGLTAKLIDKTNEFLTSKNAPGAAKHIPLGSSNFNGVLVTLKVDNKDLHQPIIIDERAVKNVKQLLDEDKSAGGGTILFATALTFEKNKKYLDGFKAATKKGITLDPIIIVSESVTTDTEINEAIIGVLMRLEAKLFSSVKESVAADKGKELLSSFNTNGQDITLILNPKNSNISATDMIMGASGPVLGITARVEVLGGVKNGINNLPTPALRPVVLINGYDKPKTIARCNLEYALLAIASSTMLLEKDKVFAALLPSKGRNNIGNLNPLIPVVLDPNGNHKQINLADPRVDFNNQIDYLEKSTVDASLYSIGLDVEYRITTSALNTFGAIVDGNASAEAREEAVANLSSAFQNVTGTTYSGQVTESSILYPIGYMIDQKGNKVSLREVDAIWLASLPLDGGLNIKLAEEWLVSNISKNGLQIKLEILKKVQEVASVEIKPTAIGMKIILTNEFVNALVQGAGFVVNTTPALELPNRQSSLGQLMTGFKTTGTQINSVGVSYGNNTGMKYNIIG